jgi:hypothetical protein
MEKARGGSFARTIRKTTDYKDDDEDEDLGMTLYTCASSEANLVLKL